MMKRRVVCYVDGAGKEYWQIQYKGWFLWHSYVKWAVPHVASSWINVEYDTYEEVRDALHNLISKEKSEVREVKQIIPV